MWWWQVDRASSDRKVRPGPGKGHQRIPNRKEHVHLHSTLIDLVSVWKMNLKEKTKSRQIHWATGLTVRNEECLYDSSDDGEEKGSGFE